MESLYRKYRPQTFADVVGQQHVVSTLERAVLEGRTSHAYLFCGPRGTGKTTMARLLAKALMCRQGPGNLPDGTCEQCRLIAAGEHPDVYELDAASNTGVDNVREEIINRVGYAPVRGSYKVYIIDEVHMLTPAAFNALLKTLEEPPEHVVFVLCTTDPQKIPETILSRVQRFNFRAIGADDIEQHLEHVCQQEGFSFDKAALGLVVRHARGGMRDALSTLEKLSVFGDGSITLDSAQDLLGEVSGSTLVAVACAMAERNVPTLFAAIADLVDSGRDLLQFTRELSGHLRDVYVVSAVGPKPGVVDATEEELQNLKDEALAFGSVDRISRVLTVLADAASEMRTAPNQRLVLELAVTRVARPKSDLTIDALADRVAELERTVANLAVAGVAAPASAPAPQPAPAPAATPVTAPAPVPQPAAVPSPAPRPAPSAPSAPPAPKPAAQPLAPEPKPAPNVPAVTNPGELQRKWKQVVDELVRTNPPRGSLLQSSTAESDDGQVLLVNLPSGSAFAAKMLERPDVRGVVDPVVRSVFGGRELRFVESSLRGADIARNRPATPAPAPRPAPAPQPAPAPRPAPAPASVPVAVPRPVAAPVPEPAPVQQYSAPWEDAPAYEEVPYSDADFAGYGEEEPPIVMPEPAPAPAPAAVQAPAPRPTPAPTSAPEPKPAPAPAPMPAPVSPAAPVIPDGASAEAIEIFDTLSAVFGDGVHMSIEQQEEYVPSDYEDESYDSEGEFIDEPVDDDDVDSE